MKQLIVCTFVLFSLVLAEYPNNLPKCKRLDTPCITKAANDYIKTYFGGLKDVNLSPFDPLHVKSIVLEKIPGSPVNIELKLTDLDLIGMKNMLVKSFDGVGDFNKRVVFEAVIPNFLMSGQYSIDGNVIILPVTGKGAVRIEAKNVHLKYSYDLKPVERNGQTYATLDHVKLDMNPERVFFNFENLFNGDKALSDNMNKFLNDNWAEIYKELGPLFAKSISLVIKSLIGNFFNKNPFDEYFI